jgi:hypothetical protein
MAKLGEMGSGQTKDMLMRHGTLELFFDVREGDLKKQLYLNRIQSETSYEKKSLVACNQA